MCVYAMVSIKKQMINRWYLIQKQTRTMEGVIPPCTMHKGDTLRSRGGAILAQQYITESPTIECTMWVPPIYYEFKGRVSQSAEGNTCRAGPR